MAHGSSVKCYEKVKIQICSNSNLKFKVGSHSRKIGSLVNKIPIWVSDSKSKVSGNGFGMIIIILRVSVHIEFKIKLNEFERIEFLLLIYYFLQFMVCITEKNMIYSHFLGIFF